MCTLLGHGWYRNDIDKLIGFSFDSVTKIRRSLDKSIKVRETTIFKSRPFRFTASIL